MNRTIGFIGGGAMGEALIAGLLRKEIFASENIFVSDTSPERLKFLSAKYGVNIKDNNKAIVQNVDIILFAIKPQVIDKVLKDITEQVNENHLIISIVAGVTIEHLSSYFPNNTPVIRVMPNTACLVGEGISAMALGDAVIQKQIDIAELILASVGKVLVMPENMLDAVTALSGSGPAYIYLVIEALTDAGVRVGLTREISLQLVLQTMTGAAAMVRETGLHTAQLKDMVTSPGGTTIAALEILERSGLRGAFMEAVYAAWKRSTELNASK